MRLLVVDHIDRTTEKLSEDFDLVVVTQERVATTDKFTSVEHLLEHSEHFLDYDFWSDLILFDDWATTIADSLEIDGNAPTIQERELFRFWLQMLLFPLHNIWCFTNEFLTQNAPQLIEVAYSGNSRSLNLLLLNSCSRLGIRFQPAAQLNRPQPPPPLCDNLDFWQRITAEQFNIFLKVRRERKPVVLLCVSWDVHLKIFADAITHLENDGHRVVIVDLSGRLDRELFHNDCISFNDFSHAIRYYPPKPLISTVSPAVKAKLPREFSSCVEELGVLLNQEAVPDVNDLAGALAALIHLLRPQAVLTCSEGFTATCIAYAAQKAGGIPSFIVPHGATPSFMRSYAFTEVAAWGEWMINHFRQPEQPPPSCTLVSTGAIRYDHLVAKKEWHLDALREHSQLPHGGKAVLFLSFWVGHPEEKAFKIKALRLLAQSLPPEAFLIVKKHPCYEDDLCEEILGSLLAPQQFRIVDDSYDLYELIVLATVTVIVYSSGGYESILLDRPCIILDNLQVGKTAYSQSPLFQIAKNREELQLRLVALLSEGSSAIHNYPKERQRFLTDCLTGADGKASRRFAERIARRIAAYRSHPPPRSIGLYLVGSPPPLHAGTIRETVNTDIGNSSHIVMLEFPQSELTVRLGETDVLISDDANLLNEYSQHTLNPVILLKPHPFPGGECPCTVSAAVATDIESLRKILSCYLSQETDYTAASFSDPALVGKLLESGLTFPVFLPTLLLCDIGTPTFFDLTARVYLKVFGENIDPQLGCDLQALLNRHRPPPSRNIAFDLQDAIKPCVGLPSSPRDEATPSLTHQLLLQCFPKETLICRILASSALRWIAARHQRIALFPGGAYTTWLTSLVKADIPAEKLVILDDHPHPGRRINGYPVIGTTDTSALDHVAYCVFASDSGSPSLRERAIQLFGSKLLFLFGDAAGESSRGSSPRDDT